MLVERIVLTEIKIVIIIIIIIIMVHDGFDSVAAGNWSH